MSANLLWVPGLHDATPIGFALTAAYAVAFVLVVRAFRRVLASRDAGLCAFWAFSTVWLGGLGLNKQLDLQTWWLESESGSEGEVDRRALQSLFVRGVLLIATFAAVLLGRFARRHGRSTHPAVAGLVLLGGFVVLRAASFRPLHPFPGSAPDTLNAALEGGGILLLGLGAREVLRRAGR